MDFGQGVSKLLMEVVCGLLESIDDLASLVALGNGGIALSGKGVKEIGGRMIWL